MGGVKYKYLKYEYVRDQYVGQCNSGLDQCLNVANRIQEDLLPAYFYCRYLHETEEYLQMLWKDWTQG